MTNSQLVQAAATRCVARHLTDPRPSWLWAEGGGSALWQNSAARTFKPKLKRKAKSDLIPIGRQIARALRLGVEGRASLSRMQFTIGRKPISLTCTCTPLTLSDGRKALLVVGVDAIERDPDEMEIVHSGLDGLPGLDVAHVVVGPDGEIVAGYDEARFLFERMSQTEPESFPFKTARLDAGPGAEVLFFLPQTGGNQADSIGIGAQGTHGEDQAFEAENKAGEQSKALEQEPPSPQSGENLPGTGSDEGSHDDADDAEPALSALVDRLAAQDRLYAPIGGEDDGLPPKDQRSAANDETVAPQNHETESKEAAETGTDTSEETGKDAHLAPMTEADQAESTEMALWRIVGRRITALEGTAIEPVSEVVESDASDVQPDAEVPDATKHDDETARIVDEADTTAAKANGAREHGPRLEPVQLAEAFNDPQAKYNFDELSRLLSDSVRRDKADPLPDAASDIVSPAEPDEVDDATPEAPGILSLSDEYLILNRLSLGLLVFRDQDILFANRALSELVGYADSATLRRAGLEAIFPSGDDPNIPVGAVTHLVKVDGTLVPVNARLQTITWRGRQALLLSAHERLERPGAEALVRDFAKTLSDVEQSGFFETSRAGVISSVSGRCAELLERSPDVLIGRPLYGLIALSEGSRLRKFLDRPARFAGEARPSITLAGSHPGLSVMLFAEGQAGIITGYFGFLRRLDPTEGTGTRAGSGLDPTQLVRLARGIRRPLNSIIGFSDLIRLSTFGPIENGRYIDYARDIKTAGFDIVGLVDELEDYARLCESGYAPAVADFNLSDLLDQCVSRIRGYAGQSRVLVRSAISTRLPLIKADKASLGQAILNLLATAIAHTPSGGQVVLSANVSAGRGVEVHIRDSAEDDADSIEDRFVVFRDGVDAEGLARKPLRSALGLTLTRSLLAINQCALRFDPTGGPSTLMSLAIPADMVAQEASEEGKGADF